MIQFELDFSAPEDHPELLNFVIPDSLPLTMGPRVASQILGVHIDHVYYLIRFGRIEAWKVRRSWRIWQGALKSYAVKRSA